MNLLDASSHAIESATPVAILLAFLFGVASSFGPCMISRFAVISSVPSRGKSTIVPILLFLGGIIAVYVALAVTLNLVNVVLLSQSVINGVAAAAFAVAGIVLLVRQLLVKEEPNDHHHATCESQPTALNKWRGHAGLFGIGVLAGLNLNPCCAPWLFMALAITAQQRNTVFAIVLVIAFGVGHGVPLLLYGSAAQRLARLFDGPIIRTLLPLASIALMFWLAVYYGVQT